MTRRENLMGLRNALGFVSLFGLSGQAEAQEHGVCSVVSQALRSAQAIKAGMTRGEVKKLFSRAGGVTFRKETVYVYKDCELLKIKVNFDYSKESKAEELDDDIISGVSDMFVGWPSRD